jgi:hypothetical protein
VALAANNNNTSRLKTTSDRFRFARLMGSPPCHPEVTSKIPRGHYENLSGVGSGVVRAASFPSSEGHMPDERTGNPLTPTLQAVAAVLAGTAK